MASLREQSTSTLQGAIHSKCNAGECLRRVNVCLATYFEPENTPELRSQIRQAYVRALADIPTWAMHQAFDAWEKTGVRRPSPAEILILAQRKLQPITDELARRQKDHDARIEEERAARSRCPSPEDAARIVDAAGFTPKRLADLRQSPMALTFGEAEAAGAPPKPAHWTETAAPDSRDMERLRAARAANPLVQAALADQARNERRE